ncbi:hypothetical protein [Neorhizobium sp. LjRoot104]|uniref:hypothetical protein n=1 Tax=Neorhizobium sp. LjRoot104 TaxID=3342254 RepID=UPI003ECFBD4F
MADFSPAWAHDGERRVPTADEIETGFGCGPFSLPLWNWMFYAIWSEVGEVITHAGLTPDNGDMTQLRQAIQEMIDAATGGGDTSSYLTLLQASSRLPIFPEVQTVTGHFTVVSPGTGQVRVPAGVTFQHRGISPYTTVQTDFATDASKTYHLRWNKTDGLTLKDLASGTYNPGTLPETDASFDSTYDNMLVARVITNSSNVPTITNLANKIDLFTMQEDSGAGTIVTGPGTSGNDCVQYEKSFTLNWARTPVILPSGYAGQSGVGGSVPVISGWANRIMTQSASRYTIAATVQSDYAAAVTHNPIGGVKIMARA